jgi:6-phosphogluconolactonase
MRPKTFFTLLALAVLFLLGTAPAGHSQETPGAVYTMTNSTGGNSVWVFDRASNGRVVGTPTSYATGGTGTGAGLGNQGGVVMSQDGRWLFVVNAGSNDISAFAVEPTGLRLVDVADSGGGQPISLAVDRNLLYVLNAGGAGNISGFTVGPDGTLSPLPGSTRSLSGTSTGPAQIGFTPDGNVLVVTEKAANNILTYTVGSDGYASGPTVHASSGETPFGFAFGKRGQLFVSEAFGGGADLSAASSYIVSPDGDVEVVSASVGTTETAACWLIVTKGGRFLYTTNTGSGSVSGYAISFDGSITLLDADGRTGDTGAESRPIDMALSADGRYLYTLNGGNHSISVFRVQANGKLIRIAATAVMDLPEGTNGLAAR